MRRAGLAALIATLVLVPSAGGASLPSVKSGQRPGPPLLYGKAPQAPQLSVQAPFSAKPLLVSGTDAYRDGEYLYQDYLFDDHGADTVPASGNGAKPGPDSFSPSAGDVAYPTAERYANNAADLVELRIKPTTDAIVYRVTLNTVKAADAAVVGIGIDRDRSGGVPVPWPGGAGISSPGLDLFITAWGTGGKVTGLPVGVDTALPPGAVTVDAETNQMTIRVPRSIVDPGESTWRYVAGVGLYNGGEGFRPVPAGSNPTAEQPASGSTALPAPAVFNLAFRFDEPSGSNFTGGLGGYTTGPGVGNFFEDKQARDLKNGTTGDFHADVDFAKLAAGTTIPLHTPAGSEQARIHASRLNLPEGVKSGFPEYGGRLQPYLLTVPPSYRPGRPAGLTFTLHSLAGTYTQYKVFSPNQLRQFGDQRGDLVVSPLARGPDGWYTDEGEVDVFEVWADVARNFDLDPESVALSGYSMGGYGTYKLGTQYPDLFGRAFTTVGPPGRGIWIPPAPASNGQHTNSNLVLENARWVPYLNWAGARDELVPYPGVRAQQARFDRLSLRSVLETFPNYGHFDLAIQDQWGAARDFLGAARVKRDPSRVNYAFLPDADRPKLGLRHDHAYWVSRLRVRDRSGDPDTAPARGEIDVRSLAFGEGDPLTIRVTGAGGDGRPQPTTMEGTAWDRLRRLRKRNRLRVSLQNVRAATVDGRRARLRGNRPLRIQIKSDGAGELRLNLSTPRGTRVRRLGRDASLGRVDRSEVRLTRRRAIFRFRSGTREYVISRPAARRLR